MHVALLTTSWPASEQDPAGHFVRAHARELERAGCAVTVVTPEPGGAFGWPGAAARIRERPIRALNALGWALVARRRIQRLEPDRIVAHWAVPCAWPIAMGAKSPLEIVSHGGDVRLLIGLPAFARKALVRRLSARAESWRFVSSRLLGDLLATLDPETRERLQRVARVEAAPLELPDVASAVAELRRQLGARRVAVSVGRLVQSKRVDKGIEYVSRSSEVERLIVIGDGPERPRLERLARELGVDAQFEGVLDRGQALAWIGAADLLIHASEQEGLSTVIREARALGTRVLQLE